MAEKTPNPELVDYLQTLTRDQDGTTDASLPAPAESVHVTSPASPDQVLPTSVALETSLASPVASAVPEPAPSTQAASASPVARPLAYFTTPAKEGTKKQSVYLPVELHRALATVVNLPGVEVSLSDLLANIVQAWREDHRAEVRKRYRDGEKSI
jgi:hypothetical protein